MKKHFSTLTVFALVVVIALTLVGFTHTASAAPVDVFQQSCDATSQGSTELCDGSDTKLLGQNSFWTRIVNTMIFVTAALSVVMIVIGGFRYSVSGGDQSAITSAKNTILYSIIGLVVAIVAYAIVNFVITEVLGQ